MTEVQGSTDTTSDSDDNTVTPKKLNVRLSPKEMFLYNRMKSFYNRTDNKKIDRIIDIVDEKYQITPKITLRMLEWFATKYSAGISLAYALKHTNDPEDTNNFNVHINYDAQLKSYHKKYFDPFRRRTKKFVFNFDKDRKLLTTLCQLNFFRWVYEGEIIEYIEKNYDVVSTAFIAFNKLQKKIKEDKKTSKDEKKVVVVKKGVNVTAKKQKTGKSMKITVSFD